MNKDQVQVVQCQVLMNPLLNITLNVHHASNFSWLMKLRSMLISVWTSGHSESENESETDTDLPDPGFIDAKPADTSLKNVAQQLADVHVKKEQPKSY